jgi:Putative Flp pilus-assembly TadE/G-like
MTRLQTRLRDERGMTLVMVATGMVAFLSATMLAVDVGMLMVARTEAQNAADAGALAGAVALGFDDFNDRSATGPAKLNAIAAATSADNGVMNKKVSVFAEDVTFPTTTRVRVRVQRSSIRGNPVSTFIAPMFGIDTVDVGAVATAEVSPANAMTCVKPFTVPDKWIEKQTPPWDPSDTFDLFDKKGDPLANPDVYVPLGPAGDPDNPQTGYTGYNAVADKGTLVTLKAGTGTNITPSFYFPYAIGGVSGADEYRENIAGCNSTIMDFDDLLMAEPGNMTGPTKQGIEDLIAKDPSARWDTANKRVISSMHPSPRVVAIPLFDPVYYETGKQNGRNADLKVVNYMGFFIEEMQGKDVVGRVTPIGGILSGSGGPAPVGTFPIAIVLVQ